MVVSHLRRFVYIGPPKTASSTLHHWLTQPVLCEQRWTGNEPQHVAEIPPMAAGYFVFASVRNPFSRAVSLWAMSQRPAERTVYPELPKCAFAEFVEQLQELPRFYRATQDMMIGDVQLDAVVRMEAIEKVLELPPIAQAAGRLEPLPHFWPGGYAPWPSFYTSELVALVRQHFAADFQRFGYSERLMA